LQKPYLIISWKRNEIHLRIYNHNIRHNKFHEPENIGYPINTTKDDLFYCPSENEFIGYTASIFDKTKDLSIIIKIERFNASNTREAIINDTITTEIAIEKKQESFGINCILFQFDDYGLSKTATWQIDLAYKLLTRVRSANLVIIGHTDAIGSNKYNISLSQKRALSVQNYLIKKGINPRQLDVKWEGETHPVASNKNPNGTDNSTGSKFNRRVCFNFLNIPENVSVKYINNIPEYLKIRY